MPNINRKYKDTVFRRLFGEGEKENLLSLYNALNNSHYENPDELEITTIEDVIYMGKKNDVSFIIDDTLTLMEHQSTFSPNLPLRGLMYFAKVYEGQLGDDMQVIYSSFDLKIPFPKYYVLYNGERKIPERMELKLSDMYINKEGKVCDLECIAHIININYGNNKKLLNACKTLNDYAKLISEIRNRRKDGKITYESIDEAVDYCIEHNILKRLSIRQHPFITLTRRFAARVTFLKSTIPHRKLYPSAASRRVFSY